MDKDKFEELINSNKECEHLEFKRAENNFPFNSGDKSLFGYYVALANERGGKLVLGVTDKIPREVIGTAAFQKLEAVKLKIYQKFHRTIEVEEVDYEGKRVLIFKIPSRPIGEALDFDGKFLMREGESLVPMNSETHNKISKEYIQDFSSELAEKATMSDLDTNSIKTLRALLKTSRKVEKKVGQYSDKQLLVDLGLIRNNGVTYAALILLGKTSSLGLYLPSAEVRYQYKEDKSKVRGDMTDVFRGGYLGYYNELWQQVDSRNVTEYLQVGLRKIRKKTFEEETIQEAINNSIIHRSYSETGPIMISQSPKEIIIKSPGGFLSGITIENIAEETKLRNRLLADVLSKCDFVEAFGNGVDLMIQHQLSSGKKYPDYNKTTRHTVILEIDGNVYDPSFAEYVSKIAIEENKEMSYKELLVLTLIKQGKKISINQITEDLYNLGLIEKIGVNKYILSKKYYIDTQKKGEYTRRKGLPKNRNKELVLQHLREYSKGYMEEFFEVLGGDVSKPTINRWLRELREEGKVDFHGNPQSVRGDNRGYWYLKE